MAPDLIPAPAPAPPRVAPARAWAWWTCASAPPLSAVSSVCNPRPAWARKSAFSSRFRASPARAPLLVRKTRTKKIRVLLVDDHAIVRDGIKAHLARQEDLSI